MEFIEHLTLSSRMDCYNFGDPIVPSSGQGVFFFPRSFD